MEEIALRVVNRKNNARFLAPQAYMELERRIAEQVSDIGAVVYYSFDWRTRVGPFVGSDLNMPNCGIRTVGAAFTQAGFNTRVVLGNWNPQFDIRYAQLNGKQPEVFGVGSMQIHSADAHLKIEQATSMGCDRPLIIGGGPHANYQAWDFFSRDPKKSVDVVVKGEINVTLGLIEIILSHKAKKETMLEGFRNARRAGVLDSLPGLMYITDDHEELVDTGRPMQIADLDEFPQEIIGLGLLESPSETRRELMARAIPLESISKTRRTVVSMFTSAGCNFDCGYCPIPENHQYSERAKSPARMVRDIQEIVGRVKPAFIFGSDDNAFAFNHKYLDALYGAMAAATVDGVPFRDAVIYGTEGTQHQANLYSDRFGLMRDGGLRALWFGIEDLTKTLVKKGQSPEKTAQVFKLLRQNGIAPMPMMMHFCGQPLRGEPGNLDGILDQVDFLRKHGAVSVQVTYNSPSIGSRDYTANHYDGGTVLSQAGDMAVEPYLFDGNHVISTTETDLLARQRNMIKCYERFFNMRNLFGSAWDLIKAKFSHDRGANDVSRFAFVQQWAARKSLRISKTNIMPWLRALGSGNFEYATGPPATSIPIRYLTS